jgi:vancomycin permeability regulator SanA
MVQRHQQAPPLPYDVIVVLGAAVWPGGQPSPALRRRVLHAVDLLQRGYASYLLVTGGVGKYPPAESEVMQRIAVAHGIPGARIVLEDQATSTFESACRCRNVLWQCGWSRVLIVTDRYHLTRALLAFRSVGVRAVGSAVPGKPARRPWQRSFYYLREKLALAWYLGRAVPVALRRWRQALGYGTGANTRR